MKIATFMLVVAAVFAVVGIAIGALHWMIVVAIALAVGGLIVGRNRGFTGPQRRPLWPQR